MLGMQTYHKLALECEVCLRDRDEEQIDEDCTEVALFGVKAYCQCPGCGRIVRGQLEHDPEYRRRARVRHFEKTGQLWPV